MLHKKRKPSTFTSSSGSADCKRDAAGKNMLHSKSTYFYRWDSLIPTCCGLALLLGVGIILNPAINDNEKAHAETITTNPTDYSSISLTISNKGTELNQNDTVSTDVQPGFVNYISNNLKIDTKKINRFYVSIQAAEDGTSELTGTDKHATIAPVGSNKIPTATDENGFGDNTWGFALGETSVANDGMVYNSLPAYGTSTTPDYSSASNLADGSHNLKLTFAAKINADKPNDHYTTKAMVSVAADAAKLTWDNIERMQDMTSEVCNSATNGASKQLEDIRINADGKTRKYWIGKMNGQCIMTQNLDYDLNTAVALTPEDSDVRSNWAPTANTLTGTSWSWTDSNDGHIESFDPGLYYIKDATSSWTACTTTKNPADCNRYAAISDPNAAAEESLHYAVGNYYNWYAATAGTGGTGSNGTASGSICPKGWKLFDNDGAKSFQTILTGATYDTVRKSPYYFPAAGYAYSGGLRVVGSYGGYWSSTRNSNSIYAYHLGFSSGDFNPQNYSLRYLGYSVRCVAE